MINVCDKKGHGVRALKTARVAVWPELEGAFGTRRLHQALTRLQSVSRNMPVSFHDTSFEPRIVHRDSKS